MPTKKELNDEANELNLKWRREETRRWEAEAALRNLVAAAGPIETEGRVIIVIDRDPFKGQKFVRELRAAVTAAKEVLK